jgi:hypothetical protein
MMGFGVSFVFSSGNVEVSMSFLVLPRVGNIEEDPIVGWDITSLEDHNSVLGDFLDSEGIGR